MKRLVCLAVLLIAAAVFVSGYGVIRAVTYQSYYVGEGETLWEIASEHMIEQDKTRDVRELIHDIAEYNGLHGKTLQAGQKIIIPLEKEVKK